LKEVYLLSEFERMEIQQISEALGISKANAKVRLFRSRKIVREKMIVILGIDRSFADRNDLPDGEE
jgi:DNA-directed RNA polymerase specialized sigma24 family protein